MNGKVYLVGAGPGDPELLTIKALRLLRSVDVVLHDELVSDEILNLIPSRTRKLNVGKRCGEKKISQEEISFLMVALAESGLQVVRLKSGDPLIFGRAGEEIASLRHANIAHEIVPGITSALGAAASAGIPLTHRFVSSAVVLLTGHHASENETADWDALAATGATLVIYMPGHNYLETATKLKEAGIAPETPCAIISQATTSLQRKFVTTISELDRAPHLPAPNLLIVGETVRFAHANVRTGDGLPQEPAMPLALVDEFGAEIAPTTEPLA
jgi:uroporphyrin-III C-methyltransferase